MHISMVFKILGMMLMLFSLSMLTPLVVTLIYSEHTASAFFFAFALTFSLGLLMWLPYSRASLELRARDGFLFATLFWVVLGIAGGLPFMFLDAVSLSFTDAVFESISGFTTTGATVITGLDYLPKSLLYYRQQLHFIGGLGIVVIAVAIMPMLGIGGMQLYKAENIGPSKESKMTPRIAETAKALFLIYVFLTLACTLCFWLAGMTFFDALCHAYSTISTGGFANYDASMGKYNSNLTMAIAIIFMILAGMNFGLHYFSWLKHGVTHYWRNPETKMYLQILFAASLVVSGYLYLHNIYNLEESVFHGVFQVVSIMTSTGFVTTDFTLWPTFLPVFLMVISFFGGCVGSTAGGVKIGRMLIMTKQVTREVARLIHPNGVFSLKLRNWAVPGRVTDAVWAFFGVYLAVYYGIVLLLLMAGVDFTTAWSATAAMINNMGPGLGAVAANCQSLNDVATWILSIAMILGRLEIFTVLVLFSPMFWRR